MKRGLLTLIAALVVGIACFYIARQRCTCSIPEMMAAHDGKSQLPELAWLHRELKLSDEQFAKVSALHLAYRPTCEALCMRVMASHEKVKALVDAGTQVTPELKAALQEHAALHVECQAAMLTHLYRTAACMSPEQAKHYRDSMLPQVIEIAMEPETAPTGHASHAAHH